jgi:hypothetical protein
MKRPAVVAFGVAAAIAVPALLIGTSSASSSHHERQFSVVSKNAQGTITPPDFGTSPAQDQQAAADAPVVRDGHKVGRSETLLTITRASSKDLEADIECTVELPHGKILIDGAFNFAHLATGVTVPVVGGTGHYEGTTGEVVLKALSSRTKLSAARPSIAPKSSLEPVRTKITFDLIR